MSVPPKNYPQWTDIVTGRKIYPLKFLAAKILLGRVTPAVCAAPTPENILDAVDRLYFLYEKNAASPSVKDDLNTIFGGDEPCNKIY